MATYVMLVKLSDEAAANIKDAKRGRDAGKKAAAAIGIEWKRSYLLMGDDYDVLVILDAPNEKTIAKFSLLGAMSGTVSTRILRAFTEAEADELVESVGELTALVS